MSTIADIRKDYKQHTLSKSDVNPHPIRQFDVWWDEAIKAEIEEINAMTLCTASSDGVPSGRIVLLKGYDDNGFVFFTNYNSFKGKELLENPRASLIFFWKELERQVRVVGVVEKVSEQESDEYFYTRPEGSRLGAWVSPQSTVIPNREWLDEKESHLKLQFGNDPVKRPPHWGGYRVKPVTIEFWQGRPSRLHDRILYSLNGEGKWIIDRLAP